MFIETLVLDRHEGMGQEVVVCRDLIVCPVHAVGVRVFQRIDRGSVYIYDICRVSFRKNIVCRHGGSIIYDLLGEDGCTDDTDHSEKKYTDYHCFKEPYANAFFLHSFFRRNILFPSGKIIFSVIHE